MYSTIVSRSVVEDYPTQKFMDAASFFIVQSESGVILPAPSMSRLSREADLL